MRLIPKRMSSFQIIIISFVLIILLGSALLTLPCATKAPGSAAFSDALFTATSATCVTGLIVQDTATYWSVFGQIVILLLIQIGGLGVVTVAVSIVYLTGKNIGLKQRSTVQEAVAAPQVGGILRLMKFIITLTFITELVGAILLAPVFCKDFGFIKGVWYALFHSVSAFCNAGFDLMGARVPYSSLTYYVSHPYINTTIMLLIVFGGLGFLTWEDILKHKFRVRRYRMQSKVILTVTAFLIIMPAIYFYYCEFTGLTKGERLWGALFQSVTARTAGFNTLDFAALKSSGVVIMITLMLVGGSPGSTAGGMKTTTFAVLISTIFATFRRNEHTTFFGRRIPDDSIRNAAALIMLYLLLFITCGVVISEIEGIPLIKCLFETASAIGTVGVTMGITPQLSTVSQSILIALMFFGRVGGLTLIFAAASGKRIVSAKLPQEKITVG